MKKILILGANSYIGTSFENYIYQKYPEDYEIHTISLHGDTWRHENWSSYDSILNVTGKAHADISKLSEEQKQEYYAINCDLAVETAKKAIEDGAAQYIYLSSIIIYGDSSNSRTPVRITADTKPAPSNFYGDSKWQAEQKLQELFRTAEKTTGHTRLVLLRLPMIYGPGCKGNYKTLVKMSQKLPLFPTYHNERSVLHIDHLTEYLRNLVDSGTGGLYLPQDDTCRSTPDMVFELAEAAGRRMYHAAWMNPFVRLAFYLPGKPGRLARKAFGTLVIDHELSKSSQSSQNGHKQKQISADPTVSIITVTYNSEKTLRHTIESVLAQTYTKIEYWIIDGASSDHTVEIAEAYRPKLQAKGIRYHILSEPDNGIYDAMNKGIRHATGEIIGIINSDDRYEPEAVQTAVETFQHTACDLMYANIRMYKADGSSFVKKARTRKFQTSRDWNHPTTFVRAECYKKYPFRKLGIHDDYGFFLQMRKQGKKIVTVDRVLADFHMGGASNHKDLKAAKKRIRDRYLYCYRINGYSRWYLIECVAIEAAKFLLG
jgi:UDP-glucose 4-epimerase